MSNIKYNSPNIQQYFSKERIDWDDFYLSEKKIIEQVFETFQDVNNIEVLDIGCACAGLCNALIKKFGIRKYTGIEINEYAAETARKNLNLTSKLDKFNIYSNDFLEIKNNIHNNFYECVFSLSCIDWQKNFELMFLESWKKVKPGGYFILSLRITDQPSINDINKSYQYINYNGIKEGEIAPYVIFNLNDIMKLFLSLDVMSIKAYGYENDVSSVAVTDYEKLCFTVFALQKNVQHNKNKKYLAFNLTIK